MTLVNQPGQIQFHFETLNYTGGRLLRQADGTAKIYHQCHIPGIDLQTTVSQGNAPAVQNISRRSRERAGTGTKRLYSLHKSYTTQVTASKACHIHLMSPGA
ncbi:hypothetical protein TNCV_4982211 [Trichonephila clavipes]|nr:hypothetical protein TNCV_4982211 [Trichonephila clavipes]